MIIPFSLRQGLIQAERQALSVSKLFMSLYWYSYITGLAETQTHLSLYWECAAGTYVKR